MKRAALNIALLIVVFSARAQDVHFSQYYFSPLSMNPAYTGNFNGDFRFFGNYRSQWRDIDRAYETYSAGGDLNFYPNNLHYSGGLLFINDMSGGNLGLTKIFPSVAFHPKFGKTRVHMGLQPGIVIKTIDFYKNSFPNQLNWETGRFDRTLPNNESGFSQTFTYFDLNAGGAISRRMGKFEPEVGFSLFHINRPRENFFGFSNNHLDLRKAVNASVSYSVVPNLILKAHTLYGFTTRVGDWVSGLTLEYVLSSTPFYANSVFAGFMWRDGISRNPDAGIVTAGFNKGPFTMGMSLDLTFSQLRTAVNTRGAYEIAVIYRGKHTRLHQKVIPCERY
jgi:type IX secretion system PorP/SprF family membrane protein